MGLPKAVVVVSQQISNNAQSKNLFLNLHQPQLFTDK